MSNFHTFGSGLVGMLRGENADQQMFVALTDLDEPMPMDAPAQSVPGREVPLHSTVLHFPTKETFTRFMSHMAEFESTFKWTE